jgi:hypothetical protein
MTPRPRSSSGCSLWPARSPTRTPWASSTFDPVLVLALVREMEAAGEAASGR